MTGKTVRHQWNVNIFEARSLIWAMIGACVFLLIAFISGSTPWDLTPHNFADVLVALLVGGIWGVIVGACFKGKENKGAIAFAIISCLSSAIDRGIDSIGAEKISSVSAEMLLWGLSGLLFGALVGRLVVAIVKWAKRQIRWTAQNQTADTALGVLAGALSAAFLILIFGPNAPFSNTASNIQSFFITSNDTALFGFFPFGIGMTIAGAIAGAMTPRPIVLDLKSSILTKVWVADSKSEAVIIKSFLESHEIDSISESHPTRDDLLLKPGFPGKLDILVRDEDAERAQTIIEEQQRESD